MINRPAIIAIAIAGALVLTCIPTRSAAQERRNKEDFTLRIEGPVSIAAGESAGAVWVIGNHADVKGIVHELVVINGTATVEGAVTGNIVLLGSDATLGSTARIGGDVLLYRSNLRRNPGAQIAGAVHTEAGVSFGAQSLWFLWASVTIALVMLGIGLAYVAGPSFERAADTITSHRKQTAISAAILIFGLPTLAILSFMTGLGFVLGLLIFLAVIPVVAFAGYFTVGLALGNRIMRLGKRRSPGVYASVALGILAMQVLTIVPVIGGLILLLSGQIGAGAILYRAWMRDGVRDRMPSLMVQPA